MSTITLDSGHSTTPATESAEARSPRIHSEAGAASAIAIQGLRMEFGPSGAIRPGGGRSSSRTSGRTIALEDVHLSVPPGQRLVILGHNGSGKSTMLRCLTRLIEPTHGRVWVEGEPVTGADRRRLRRIRRRMGMVFQKFHLVPNLSVFQNVLFGAMGELGLLGALGLTASLETRGRAMEALERVGLADLASRRADRLSGGQQQRVAIARMLMQQPRIILADEPVASLDPRAGREVMELLWSIAMEQRLTVLCTLHQIDMARQYGERIIGLHRGRIVFDGTGDQLDRRTLAALYATEHPGSRGEDTTEAAS
ncbi:MAG: phosphonate ABC transporter ATP-binding protein [Phycisphaeraceae bacterium]|nr:phosphonate ABC transporter ATP-binding protein [Phycisphaeraceae bacterium]